LLFLIGFDNILLMNTLRLVLLTAIFYPLSSMAIEEPTFTIEKEYSDFAIRKYGPVLVAQTEVKEDFEGAGNKAFGILADYIFGKNISKTKMSMTAPVTQQSEKLSMTAPVNLSKSEGGFVVQFIMPSKYTRETLPEPVDSRVAIVEMPPRSVAVYSYSGSWSEQRYKTKLAEFQELLKKENIKSKGEAVFARFNSPFQLWFLRRNEIWLEVAK
jgi:SOUL heme-binding protein